MIASVRGKLIFMSVDHAVIETGGIGWMIYAPRNVLSNLGELGGDVMLYTYMHIREDIMALYGFATLDQRHLFETLLTVSGVGPRVALSLLSSGSTDEVRVAIAGGDTTRLSRVPGIGKKMAERIALELKGKVAVAGVESAMPTAAVSAANADLSETLISLGFSAAEANAAIAALPADAPTALEERLRIALRYFGSA
ncbi:MAG TPA: Holliday junction branch migration protein RuvA [Roseiflexaceae bacterium]|nr:Holliday junction branch migration protein RuvA [Roseiflexaceae bacterium]